MAVFSILNLFSKLSERFLKNVNTYYLLATSLGNAKRSYIRWTLNSREKINDVICMSNLLIFCSD